MRLQLKSNESPYRPSVPGPACHPAPFPPSLLGRSQAVRQRILISPFGGSMPPAPASATAVSESSSQAVARFPQIGDRRRSRSSAIRSLRFVVESHRCIGKCDRHYVIPVDLAQSSKKRKVFKEMKWPSIECSSLIT